MPEAGGNYVFHRALKTGLFVSEFFQASLDQVGRRLLLIFRTGISDYRNLADVLGIAEGVVDREQLLLRLD